MNRFRTRRKAKEDLPSLSAPASPHIQEAKSGPFKRFGREKKSHEEETKKELDLTNALPPSDDFRTSLLMTGLSARFSMLREQDDPNTKVGKASDDSVIFTRRQSRLPDFGYASAGLGDIAEVESLNAVKSPTRKSSFGSDDAASTASGSVMARGKPTEGNNLFGGRQKIYKIVGEGRGKALYGDDVALSAFQKLRAEEKMRRAREEEEQEEKENERDDSEARTFRAPSPTASEFNRRRETSSTMSSTPSIGRNSTAATSVTSTSTPSLKDWGITTPLAGQAGSASGPIEGRSVQRTRRLYEQGLNQELHEQQSSALSRIDTLSRRALTARAGAGATETNAPSSTSSMTFAERQFYGERRIIGKIGGGTGVRTFTPPPTSLPQPPPTTDKPVPPLPVNPPPSSTTTATTTTLLPHTPPISDIEDHSAVPTAPVESSSENSNNGNSSNGNDKAALLGMAKYGHGYDDAQYAQRQLEMNKGRETPTQQQRFPGPPEEQASLDVSSPERMTTTSNGSNDDTTTTPVKPSFNAMTFLDSSPVVEPALEQRSPAVNIEKIDDGEQHSPVARDDYGSLPSPLSLSNKVLEESSSFSSERGEGGGDGLLSPGPKPFSPSDSPTLGPTRLSPTTGGLSGMVRQHLRGLSNASSMYGGANSPSDSEAMSPDPFESKRISDFSAVKSFLSTTNAPPGGQDWGSLYNAEIRTPMSPSTDADDAAGEDLPSAAKFREEKRISRDEFASQLADGARRVRERLTSYVEADSRSTSPAPEPDLNLVEGHGSRSSPRGILKPKLSKTSINDRSRAHNQQKVKAMNMLGIGATTMTSATNPSPGRRSFEENDNAPIYEDKAKESDHETDQSVHAGLRAFRQAKRDLQLLKKTESSQGGYQYQVPANPPANLPSVLPRDRRPPPVVYNREPGSRSSSRGPSMRDRSGSETSSGGSRPPRARDTMSSPADDPEPVTRKPPMIRVPGLPGTDIKRSPIMPPPPGTRYERSPSAQGFPTNIHGQPFRAYDPAQASPVSLSGLPSPLPSPYPLPSHPSSPANPPGAMSYHPALSNTNGGLYRADESANRGFNRRGGDVLVPQIPAVALDGRPRSDLRSRSGSGAGFAPPLPPINPKRRNVLGSMMGRRGDQSMTSSTPNLSLPPTPGMGPSDDERSAFSVSDEDDATTDKDRRKLLLKVGSDSVVGGLASRFRGRGGSPPNKTPGRMI